MKRSCEQESGRNEVRVLKIKRGGIEGINWEKGETKEKK